jgi:hypothetical protein
MGANSDGRFQTRLTSNLGLVPSNIAAATEVARVRFFTQTVVREVRATILVPGTTTDCGFTILKATTSIGAVTCGLGTAGAVVDASLTDTTFTAVNDLVFKNITSDTNLEVRLMVDYSELFSAT